MARLWEIKYEKNSVLCNRIRLEFIEKPSIEQVAQKLWDALFSPFIIPDTPRNIKDKTVFQLESLGVQIICIDEVNVDG